MEKADKPAGLQKACNAIDKAFDGKDDLKGDAKTKGDIDRALAKMGGRFESENCQALLDHMFELAASKMESEKDKTVLAGLRNMVKSAENNLYRTQPKFQDAFFFPNMANIKKMVKYISMARTSIDLCIFSFTNDDLANEVIAAHQRGVTVRIITDDEAMKGKGADSQRCSDAGIAVRTDNAEQYHMHNKFMIVDKVFLVTGSFNWTFQAGKSNQENVVVLDGKYYIDKYVAEFANLWGQFADQELEREQHKAATAIQKQFKNKQARKKQTTSDGWNMN